MKQGLHINKIKEFWGNDENGEYKLLYPDVRLTGEIEVALPHSCDEWVIANGKPKDCIKILDDFIKEIEKIKTTL